MAICYCWFWFALAALLALAPVVLGTRLVRLAGMGLVAASIFMAVSQFREMPTFDSEAAPLPDSLFVLNGVPLRASVPVVVTRLGQPSEVTNYIDTTLTDTIGHFATVTRSVWQYDSLSIEVQLTDSHVVSMECVDQPCALPLGIGPGTTRAELKSRLGSPARSASSSVTYMRRLRDCDIRFGFDEAERVSAIKVRCDNPARAGVGLIVPP
jgi:hypothetical protein